MERLTTEKYKTSVYAIPVKTKIKNVENIPEDIKMKISEQIPFNIRKDLSITILNQYLDLNFLRVNNAFNIDKFELEAGIITKDASIGHKNYVNYKSSISYHKTNFKLIILIVKMLEDQIIDLSGMSLLQSFSKNEFDYIYNVTSLSNGIKYITNLSLFDTFNKELSIPVKNIRHRIDANLYIDMNSTTIKNVRFIFNNTELRLPNANSMIKTLRLDELDYKILNSNDSFFINFCLHDALSMKRITYN